MDTYQANGIDSRILDFLASYFSISKKSVEEHSWRKYLAAIWNIDGYFSLCNQKIDYQGAQIHQFIDRVLSTLKEFRNENSHFIDHELVDTLIQLVDQSRIGVNDDARLYTFNKHLPVMIHGGNPEHHMEVVVWDHYLLICNKGYLSEMPVKVYTIDPDLVNAKLLKNIKDCSDKFEEEAAAAKFYSSTLPDMLNGIQHETLSNLFTEKWIDESLFQTGENCVWESLRAALFGVAGLDAWIKNDCESTKDSEIHAQTISEGLKQLLPWDQYVGLVSLEQYIDFSAGDPAAMDRNLVMGILNKAKELMHDKKVDNVHYEEVVAKFIHTRAKAIEIENANDLGMDVEGF